MRRTLAALTVAGLVTTAVAVADTPLRQPWHPSCQHLAASQRTDCQVALLTDRWSYAGTIVTDQDVTARQCWQLTADALNAYFDCPGDPIGIAGDGR